MASIPSLERLAMVPNPNGSPSLVKWAKRARSQAHRRRPLSCRLAWPDSDQSGIPPRIVGIHEQGGVVLLIGPDGKDLNDEPLIRDRCQVALKRPRSASAGVHVLSSGVECLSPSRPSQPN